MRAHESAPGVSRAGDRTILKSEVHKHGDEHVLLTSIEASEDRVLVGGFRLSATQEQPRFADFMEVQRQAGILHAHRHLGVPTTDVFVLNSIELFITDIARIKAGETGGIVEVRADKASAQTLRVREAAHRFAIATESGVSGVGASHASFVPRPVYERLRTSRRPTVRAPRSSLTQTMPSLTLAPPTGDPLVSDHASDHVSAMAVVLSIENGLHGLFHDMRLIGISLRFFSYVELSAALSTLHVTHRRETEFNAVVSQGDYIHVSVDGFLTPRDRS